jgi:hypothetical protein
MANDNLVNYIEKSLKAGKTEEEIKINLLSVRWKEELINEAFDFVKNKQDQPTIDIVETQQDIVKEIIENNPVEEILKEPKIEPIDNQKEGFVVVENKFIDASIKNEVKENIFSKKKINKKIVYISLSAVLLIAVIVSGYFIFSSFFNKKIVENNQEEQVAIQEELPKNETIYGPFNNSEIILAYIYEDTDGHGFYYTEEGKYYANVNGRTFGPYDEPIMKMKLAGSNFAFLRGDIKGPLILNINGNDYPDLCTASTKNCYIPNFYINSLKDYAFDYCTITGNCFVVVNEKKYGPYATLLASQFYDDKFGFSYKSKTGYFVNINGTDYGPFKKQKNFFVYGNNYGFEYEINAAYKSNGTKEGTGNKVVVGDNTFLFGEKTYGLVGIGVNINGTNYDGAYNLSSFKNSYGFISKSWSDYEKVYFNYNFNGMDSQEIKEYTYSDNPGDLYSLKFLLSDSNFGYVKDSTTIVINGKEYNNGASLFIPQTQEDFLMGNSVNSGIKEVYYQIGTLAFKGFGESNGFSYYIGGKTYGSYQLASLINYACKINNDLMFAYSKDGKDYININEVEYGPYDQVVKYLYGFGKVGFKYKKDNKVYCNFINKEFGPYEEGFDCQILKGKYILKYKDDVETLKQGTGDKYFIKIISQD